MPCEQLFSEQTEKYKDSVLLENPKLTVVFEASNDNVWFKYTNKNDMIVNVNQYQYSANGKEVYEKAGFNVQNIKSKILHKLKK